MSTLEEALDLGRGIERPFRCPVHEDTHASASVNVLKLVWYCYACQARGTVDGKRVPTDTELAQMLAPETPERVYPQAWLELFGVGGYWETRFPRWVCWMHMFGEDPLTGEATFPVHTPKGLLAGVGRRRPEGQPRYVYPQGWSASTTLWGHGGRPQRLDIIALTEGAADAASLWEVGIPAFAVYGSGLHYPQRQQVAAMAPSLVLLGFDRDEAGRRGTVAAHEALADIAETVTVDWSIGGSKDPADLVPTTRLELALEAVAGTSYRPRVQEVASHWHTVATHLQDAYENREE